MPYMGSVIQGFGESDKKTLLAQFSVPGSQ